MLVIVLLLIIIAISLNYFNENVNLQSNVNDEIYINSNISIIWKRIVIILLLCILPILWESKIYEDIYIFNGLLLLTGKLNLVIWLLFITGISLITTLTQQSLTNNIQNERIIFTLCAILGSIILNNAVDFLTILLGLELQSYSVYILAASYRNYEPSEAAGLKYFLLGALSSSLVFMGLAILYTFSGSTNLNTTFLIISSSSWTEITTSILDNNIILPYIGIILLIAGILWKIAAAPVQAWSIDVYDAVPTRTTAILSLLPKIALFSLLIRLISMFTQTNNIFEQAGIQIIIIIIILSLFVGSIAGLFQPRIKRLLAYSSVLNIGFILMSILLNNSIVDFYNPTLYISQYILTTTAIWLCLINLANINNNSEITLISQLQGIHTNSNKTFNTTIIATCLTILILSTAGIPPMVGFYAKYSVILTAMQSGYTSLALIAVFTSIISTVYYLGIIRTIWGTSSSSLITNSISNNNNISESTLLISFFTLIIVLYLLQYSVIYVLISTLA